MSDALTGTRRAYDRCGGCGHARQRHRLSGQGPCADVTWRRLDTGPVAAPPVPMRCRCPDFIEPSKEN